jgi:hypothetical protein
LEGKLALITGASRGKDLENDEVDLSIKFGKELELLLVTTWLPKEHP